MFYIRKYIFFSFPIKNRYIYILFCIYFVLIKDSFYFNVLTEIFFINTFINILIINRTHTYLYIYMIISKLFRGTQRRDIGHPACYI